jgi:hypothetical protein
MNSMPYRYQPSGRSPHGRPRRSGCEVARIEAVILVLAVAWLAGFGAAAAWQAMRRRRRPAPWAVFGAILGPGALVLLSIAPPGRCWKCTSRTTGWLTTCLWCGEDVRGPEPEVATASRRVRGSLTVIDGTAPQRGADPASGLAGASSGAAETAAASRAPLWTPGGPDPASRAPLWTPGEPDAAPLTAAGAEAASTSAPAVAAAGPGSDSVRQLRSRLPASTVGTASTGAAVDMSPTHATVPVQRELHDVVLATAIFMTGNRGLQAGGRYGIAIVDDELRILGPVDIDPAAVAITHPLAAVDASGFQERLIITGDRGRRRERLALVFMSVAGGSAERVADAIVRTVAASQAGQP